MTPSFEEQLNTLVHARVFSRWHLSDAEMAEVYADSVDAWGENAALHYLYPQPFSVELDEAGQPRFEQPPLPDVVGTYAASAPVIAEFSRHGWTLDFEYDAEKQVTVLTVIHPEGRAIRVRNAYGTEGQLLAIAALQVTGMTAEEIGEATGDMVVRRGTVAA